MFSLKDFIEAMSASWPVAFTIFLGSAAVLVGDIYGIEQMAALPPWVVGTAFIATAFSAAVVIVAAIRAIMRTITSPFRKRRYQRWVRNHVDGIQNLPSEEMHILAWAIACKTQVISAPYFDARTKALTAKGYLRVVPGNHHTDSTPFMIPDHVWSEIIKETVTPEFEDQMRNNPPFSRSRYWG